MKKLKQDLSNKQKIVPNFILSLIGKNIDDLADIANNTCNEHFPTNRGTYGQ